jgi:hypothetical protein
MLKHDLATARAAWIAKASTVEERKGRSDGFFLADRDHGGRVADFHGLRHTFITRLVKSGVNPKEAQTMARHSSITLTMDRYAHVVFYDAASAVKALPPLPCPEPNKPTVAALGATGTDALVTFSGNRRSRNWELVGIGDDD